MTGKRRKPIWTALPLTNVKPLEAPSEVDNLLHAIEEQYKVNGEYPYEYEEGPPLSAPTPTTSTGTPTSVPPKSSSAPPKTKWTPLKSATNIDTTPWNSPWQGQNQRSKDHVYGPKVPSLRQTNHWVRTHGIWFLHQPNRDNFVIQKEGRTYLKDSREAETFVYGDHFGTLAKFQENETDRSDN